jgi:hypothetical protein
VYKGAALGCVDVIRPQELHDHLLELRRRGGEGLEDLQGSDVQVELLYRVCAGNRFGWGGFSEIGTATLVPCDSSVVREATPEEAEELDDRWEVQLDDFPPWMLGLDEQTLQRPEHFERQLRLPCISRKYRPPVGTQKAALTSGIWHSYLPVDPEALARRRERLMRYRAKAQALR